jgi:hypothetical protein
MIDEAISHGLRVNRSMYNHLVLGRVRKGGSRTYVAPDFKAKLHNSMTLGWLLLEWLPKPVKRREWPSRVSVLGFYLPLSEPRHINDGAHVHESVFARMNADSTYRPVNLPSKSRVVIEALKQDRRKPDTGSTPERG